MIDFSAIDLHSAAIGSMGGMLLMFLINTILNKYYPEQNKNTPDCSHAQKAKLDEMTDLAAAAEGRAYHLERRVKTLEARLKGAQQKAVRLKKAAQKHN